jgi:hypothetical protein
MSFETPSPGILVNVRRRPADRLRADYRLSDISRMRWDYISGGLSRRSQWHVYGYVMCDAKISGKVAHSCKHGPPPHKIKICVTKKHNENIGPLISEKVGPKPMPRRSKRRLKRLRRRLKRRTNEALARV